MSVHVPTYLPLADAARGRPDGGPFGLCADALAQDIESLRKRLEEAKAAYPKAQLADPADVNVIYLLIDEPGNYHEYSVAQSTVGPMTKKQFLATLARPFKAMKA